MPLRKENIFLFILITSFKLVDPSDLSQNSLKKYGCCFYKEKLHTNGFCLFGILGIARRIVYPALFTLLYFIILVVAISF